MDQMKTPGVARHQGLDTKGGRDETSKNRHAFCLDT